MRKIEYACLKYYNSILSDECLYLGVLFHDLSSDERVFKYMKNFKRLEMFDDEIDIEFLKLYLEGIRQETENNILNTESFDMNSYIYFFSNEFKFTDVKYYYAEDNEDYVNNLFKVYLKYDLNRSQRANIEEEKRIIRKVLLENNVKLLNNKVKGIHNENIEYDFIMENYAIKYMDLKKKELTRLFASAKTWSYTANEMNHDFSTIFLYDYDESEVNENDYDNYLAILNILKENANVFSVEKGLEYLLSNHELKSYA